MGEAALIALATALSASIGLGAGLLGVYLGVRTITRDEERYAKVAEAQNALAKDREDLRLEWSGTVTKLQELVDTNERIRRRTSASESRLRTTEQRLEAEAPRPMTPAEERAEIRRRMPGIGALRRVG